MTRGFVKAFYRFYTNTNTLDKDNESNSLILETLYLTFPERMRLPVVTKKVL